MNNEIEVSRRRVLGMSLALAGFALPGAASPVFSQSLKRTPGEVVGPFYPILKPLDNDADLTVISGKPGRAQGQTVHLMGQVLNLKEKPVQGARIEIWQVNTHGRYTHLSDTNPAPVAPNFEGFSVQFTDSEGRYRFKTIKPGAYPADANWMRPPHIHFEITGKFNRLTTQMYFPGDPLNDKDLFFQGLRSNKEAAIAKIFRPTQELEPDSVIAVWDIVLDIG